MNSKKSESYMKYENTGKNRNRHNFSDEDSKKSTGTKLTDLCTLDLSKETSSLQLPNAFSKLMQITKQLQNELATTRRERDEAYNSLILQRDYYEQSATSRNRSKNESDGNFDAEYVSFNSEIRK
ncbi:hypothetical protein FG386_000544 [Cryptosporidium ryanae]|uniref:uncharacterized protein n=1 Tax=Cryptosporidium ryanae TaxID=515981 RepID=UPI00351A45DD|nr:hypothetical protein FG386_000544 [Cryptosporidium ryanae]